MQRYEERNINSGSACKTSGGSPGRDPAAFAVVCVWALTLTACGSLQQPEAGSPAANSPAPNLSQVDSSVRPNSSVLEGVFTARQASWGETRFRQVCAACHSISEFRGGRFRLAWVGRTVGDLFQSISTLMPEDDPGSLSPDEYSAIVSYLLRENGYPAGEEDLAADATALQDIHIVVAAA